MKRDVELVYEVWTGSLPGEPLLLPSKWLLACEIMLSLSDFRVPGSDIIGSDNGSLKSRVEGRG